MSGALKHAAPAPCLIALALVLGSGLGAAPSPSVSGTRLAGIRLGPHAVGFAVRSIVDPTRHVNAVDAGVRINLATWYPATRYASMAAPAMTALAYHLLLLGTADDADRRRYEEDEITALCSWRHVGIVELTRDQASRSLHTAGIARRDAPTREGTWPVVLMMGGPFYLASTAEMLASHGFVVIAPFRTDDQQNDVSAQAFPWYLENAVRDAEWAVHVVLSSRRPPPRLFAIGHGGGGMQAMLFTMRNRNVSALVDIDAGNFSSRSRARDLAFYSPRLLRVPYLHILRDETRRDQDQYDDFTAMAFSRRIELVLQDEAVRHHDLSDIGRAVAEPMRIRGDAQAAVEREYADVQDTIVRFLQAQAAMRLRRTAVETWLTSHDGASRHAVKVYAAIEPAPVVQQVIATLDASTPAPAPRRARPRSERRGVRRQQPGQDHRARDGRARAANGHRDRGREPRDPSRRSRFPGAEERSVPGCWRSCGGAVSCSRVRRDAGRRRLARQGDGYEVSRRGEASGQGLAAGVCRL